MNEKSKEIQKLARTAQRAGQEWLTLSVEDVAALANEAQEFKRSATAREIWDICSNALAETFDTDRLRVKKKRAGSGDNLKSALYWTMSAMGLKKTQIAQVCEISVSGVGRACKNCLHKMREDESFHKNIWAALEKAKEKFNGQEV